MHSENAVIRRLSGTKDRNWPLGIFDDDVRSGTEQWRQKSLERRQLSAPVVYRGRIVVADLAGIVHWFDAATGDPIARISIGKQRVSTPPVVAGDLLLVFGDNGELNALRAPALDPILRSPLGW